MRKTVFLMLIVLTALSNTVKAQGPKLAEQHLVEIKTAYGSCVVRLYDETPAHRDNFLKLVRAKFFNRTTFNRIIKDFVVQGGDPDSLYLHKDRLSPDQYWMKPELNDSLFHKRGVLAMGRDDNPSQDSFSTQFYLVSGKKWTDAELDNLEKTRLKGRLIPIKQREIYKTVGGLPFLDQQYTVFGEVIKGIELLDKLSALPGDKEGTPDKAVWMRLRIIK